MNKESLKLKTLIALVAVMGNTVLSLSNIHPFIAQAYAYDYSELTSSYTTNSLKYNYLNYDETNNTILYKYCNSSNNKIVDSVTEGSSTYLQNTSTTISKSNENIKASNENSSAVKVSNGGILTLSDCYINKSGDTTSEDESNIYGLNSAIVARSNGAINLENTSITTSGECANAIFATGEGSIFNVNNITINTNKNLSRGLEATYNGTINASNINIITKGINCAAIATGKSGGTINITDATGKTSGLSSPCIYSTGQITVSNSTLSATNSELAIIEGNNSITLNDTNLSNNYSNGIVMSESDSRDFTKETSNLVVSGGSLSSCGTMFCITNTNAVISLNSTSLSNTGDTLIFASTGNSGKSGQNGSNLTFTANLQDLNGNIKCDSNSTINMTLKNKSTLIGSIDSNNTGKVDLSLDNNSIWNVTDDSYLSSIIDLDKTLSNIKDNGNTIYYDTNNSSNAWLHGETFILTDGGKLTPSN